jgi:hypothetical protein
LFLSGDILQLLKWSWAPNGGRKITFDCRWIFGATICFMIILGFSFRLFAIDVIQIFIVVVIVVIAIAVVVVVNVVVVVVEYPMLELLV